MLDSPLPTSCCYNDSMLCIITSELRFPLQTIFLEKTDCFLTHPSSVSSQAGPNTWPFSFISSVLVSAPVSLDVRLKSAVIQFIQTSPPSEGCCSHINSSLLLFPLHTNSTSFKIYCKDCITHQPQIHKGSNVIEVYYFLII